MRVKRTEDDAADAEQPVATDGGNNRMFADAEVTEVTRRQRAAEFLDEAIVTPFKVAWEDWRTKTGLTIMALFVLTAIVAAVSQSDFWIFQGMQFVEQPTSTNLTPETQSVRPFTDWEYPLGTDFAGRDLLDVIVWATPTMLQMIMAGGVFSIVMATVVGTTAGYVGGRVESALMTATDIAMTIPGLPLVIVLVTIVGPENPYMVGIIITINVWAGIARTIHSQVLTLREEAYVEASRTMGISRPRIIQKDILPNMMPYILMNFVYAARRVIYDSVALYFLGILSSQQIVNWGVMMNMAYSEGNALTVPGRLYQLVVPMAPIVILSLGLILFSQGTDRLFNPRVRTRQEGESGHEDGEEVQGPAL